MPKSHSLMDIQLKGFYSSSRDSLLDDFYIPCMRNSIEYKRAVGYFSSTAFVLMTSALADFLENNGSIKIVCSPYLSESDADAIQNGGRLPLDITREALIRELIACDTVFDKPVLGSLLRKLASIGAIEFRIAVPLTNSGVYHPKVGIFTDVDGNSISFNGSVNETFMGWSELGNPESFDAFTSWKSPEMIAEHMKEFEDAWNGEHGAIKIYSSDELGEVFTPRKDDLEIDECLEIIKTWKSKGKTSIKSGNRKPLRGIELEAHQIEVINDWENKSNRGIVQFMTGGGKTITGIYAAKTWLDREKPVLILVPTSILHDYWHLEIKKYLPSIKVIRIGNGAKRQTWSRILRTTFGKQKSSAPLIFLATYQSAKTDEFLKAIQDDEDMLLIADEVHNLGAPDTSRIMENLNCPARLGLSATYRRYGDDVGTNKILSFFENELKPEFTFDDAVKAGRLVPYHYRLETTKMTEDEQERFDDITKKMIQAYKWSNGKRVSTPASQHFARERAKVIKQASNKDYVAQKVLKTEGTSKDRWLVYCNSISHLNRLAELLDGVDLKYVKYHSQIEGDRERTLSFFENVGGTMLSIKCLDEGVDIPLLDRALILASSTNPREYIQRRGRALRKAPGKNFAYIHDVIVLRDDGTPSLISEVKRGIGMAQHAENRSVLIQLVELLERWKNKYGEIDLGDSEDEDIEFDEFDGDEDSTEGESNETK